MILYNEKLKLAGKTQYVIIETKSEIQVHLCIRLLKSIHHLFHRSSRPAFCDCMGVKLTSKDIQKYIVKYLTRIQDTRPDLIRLDVNVQEEHGISRSFHRGATTHAKNQKVSKMDIDAANRWRNVENACLMHFCSLN